MLSLLLIAVVQSFTHVQLSVTPWTTAHQTLLFFTVLGVCSNSCPLAQWCHLTISSSVTLFSFCPQYLPASGSFAMSWLFASSGQSIAASVSVLSVNIQGWSPLGLTGFELLAIQGTLKSLLQHHSLKVLIFWCSTFFTVQLSHQYMTTGKTIAVTRQTFVSKMMSLLFNTVSRFVTVFLPRASIFSLHGCSYHLQWF